MKDLELLSYDVLALDFYNNMEEDTEYGLEISINYSLNYAEEDKMLVAEAEIEIEEEEHDGKFRLAFSSAALFSYIKDNLDDDMRKQYHKESVEMINPLWNETLAKFADLADIPAIDLGEPDIDDAEVFFEDGTEKLN